MKGSKKLLAFSMSILLTLSLLTACSSNVTNHTSPSYTTTAISESASSLPDIASEAEESDLNESFGSELKSKLSPLEPKKVITTIHLSFETTEFEKSNEELNKIIDKYSAYVEDSNISYDHYYNQQMYRYGEFTIRVPKDKIVSFKTELNLIGHMVSENTNKEDVTKQYQDTESRLKVVTTKEERILALLEKAEKIEDIIALEKELSEIIYEKENLKTNLMDLDDKIDYTTFYISLQEVQKVSDTETRDTSFGIRIKNAFKNSLYSFKKGIENFIIAIVYNLPYIFITGIIFFVAYKLFKKKKNKIDKIE